VFGVSFFVFGKGQKQRIISRRHTQTDTDFLAERSAVAFSYGGTGVLGSKMASLREVVSKCAKTMNGNGNIEMPRLEIARRASDIISGHACPP